MTKTGTTRRRTKKDALMVKCGACNHTWKRRTPYPVWCPRCMHRELWNLAGEREKGVCGVCPEVNDPDLIALNVRKVLDGGNNKCVYCKDNPTLYTRQFPLYVLDSRKTDITYVCPLCLHVQQYRNVSRSVHEAKLHVCGNCFDHEFTVQDEQIFSSLIQDYDVGEVIQDENV